MPGSNLALSELPFISSDFKDIIRSAGELIVNSDVPIRVISHYDADGLAAAGIISIAFHKKGIPFHTSNITSLDETKVEELKQEDNKIILFMDMGSGQCDMISGLNCKIIILDHHSPQKKNKRSDSIIEINCHQFGIDGTVEACASTLAFLLALALDPNNWDLVDLAFTGATGDKQHLEGLKGLNKNIEEEAEKLGLIIMQRNLALFGNTILEGITNSINPFFKGLTGNSEEVKKLLQSMRIDPEIRPLDMKPHIAHKLGSILTLKLLAQGVRPELAETLMSARYISARRKMDIENLSHIINSCGRMHRQSTGLAVCFGDKEALEEAEKIRADYKKQIRENMVEISKSEIGEKKAVQFFYAENPTFAGTYAGLGMQFLFDQNRPLIVLTKLETETKISGRGTLFLVNKGLNLAKALHVAAGKLKGEGGGHPVAAGATIPPGTEDKFLKEVNAIVGTQLGIKTR